MYPWVGGFIPIIIYSSNGGNPFGPIPVTAILTEASDPILTESGDFLLTEI